MSEPKQIKARLKVWLIRGKSITQNEALKMWRTSRLAVYILRLRQDGHKIKTEMIRKGDDVYAKYSMIKN